MSIGAAVSFESPDRTRGWVGHHGGDLNMRMLVAIPVLNEERFVRRVLERVRAVTEHVLVINDGSTDRTGAIVEDLRRPLGLDVIERRGNVGYGRSIRDAFGRAADRGFDWVITMDCDEQHEPAAIPRFVERAQAGDLDVVSGSRYLDPEAMRDRPPPDRRAINATITAEINERLGLGLTDAFCGFKAHRTDALRPLQLTVNGYEFPMQFWVQAMAAGLRVGEIPVKLIYNDPNRTFGGNLDDADERLRHYRCAMYKELERCADRLPDSAFTDYRTKCPGETSAA